MFARKTSRQIDTQKKIVSRVIRLCERRLMIFHIQLTANDLSNDFRPQLNSDIFQDETLESLQHRQK